MIQARSGGPNVVSLVPHTGIQFLQFPFDIEAVRQFDRPFIERSYPNPSGGDVEIRLHPGWNEHDPAGPAPYVADQMGDDTYKISRQAALEPFLEKWVPVPWLRYVPEGDRYDRGPRNWVRVRIIEEPNREFAASGPTHRAIFAFDTELLPDPDPEFDADAPYLAPVSGDAKGAEFLFVSSIAKLGWFLSDPVVVAGDQQPRDYQAWVEAWLRDLFHQFKQAQIPTRKLRDGDFRHKLEHIARWVAALDLLARAIDLPKIKFIDTVSATSTVPSINVDLVLDIGNSRTCGILIENDPTKQNVRLTDAIVLKLRDLSKPEFTYSEPFESRVELSNATFGNYRLSRASGHARAFFWPSLVRVGPEAQRFRVEQFGTEALTGMSSPKRYLWDVEPTIQEWRFPEGDHIEAGGIPRVQTIAMSKMNAAGDLISQVRKDRALFGKIHPTMTSRELEAPAQRFTFSRSSFFTLMLAEVIWQAMVMINSPEVRGDRIQKETPRKIRRIILTLPTATPTREQRIMKARVESARDLIWGMMGWEREAQPGYKKPHVMELPRVEVSWDEATCSHFVWLYGEISEKMPGRIRDFFTLFGRERVRTEGAALPAAGALPQPSIRIASIDIGGGTTDLMVGTYFEENDRAIVPVQTFREGFRTAGDDILKTIIERLVIPPIESELRLRGISEPATLLARLIGADRADMAEQDKHLRRQLVLHVFEPVGLGLVRAYETVGLADYATVERRSIRSFLPDGERTPNPRILAYLEDPIRRQGISDFSLLDVEIPLDFTKLRLTVQDTMRQVCACLSEIVDHFDCDMVLLSGRPSRMPAVVEQFVDELAVPPNRILPMNEYRAGRWYPFRAADNARIEDPKTTTVVGAMLCALAERDLPNFGLFTDRIRMRSTAAYIGIYNRGVIDEDKVEFSFADMAGNRGHTEARDVKIYGSTHLGFRQLPFQRWIASPLYRISLAPDAPDLPRPLIVTLEREKPSVEDDDIDPVLAREAAKEELRIQRVTAPPGPTGGMGEDYDPRHVLLTLRTSEIEDGYWLDTGELKIEGGK